MTRSKTLAAGAALVFAALATLSGAASAHDRYGHRYESRSQYRSDRIDERQYRQSAAIRHGIVTGQLSRREAGYLVRQQREINRAEAWAEADGHVSWRERERIEAMQDHAGRSIRREMGDRRGW
ncbi:MAG: hypothetical protein ABW067_09910 [Rhizobacter sp.]